MLRALRPGGRALLARAPARAAVRGVAHVVDKPLPDVFKARRQNRLYFVLFSGTMAFSLYALIKYEDANSPVVTSTLLALRQSPLARANVGTNIRFRTTLPWISGSPGIAGQIVDFSYRIVGDNGTATVHFRAEKRSKEHYAVTDWSITPDQGDNKGRSINLQHEDLTPAV